MPFDADKAFRDIANGNSDAFEFLKAFFIWFHTLDDLNDRDKPVLLSAGMMAHIRMLEALSFNRFYQEHKAKLFPIMETSTLAYVDSERFQREEQVLKRIASQVLKSQYQDLFYAVARLTGGDLHMLEMSRRYREFDFDPVPVP